MRTSVVDINECQNKILTFQTNGVEKENIGFLIFEKDVYLNMTLIKEKILLLIHLFIYMFIPLNLETKNGMLYTCCLISDEFCEEFPHNLIPTPGYWIECSRQKINTDTIWDESESDHEIHEEEEETDSGIPIERHRDEDRDDHGEYSKYRKQLFRAT